METIVKRQFCEEIRGQSVGGSTAAMRHDRSQWPRDRLIRVGICQLVTHDALDAATQGFMDALTEELGDGQRHL